MARRLPRSFAFQTDKEVEEGVLEDEVDRWWEVEGMSEPFEEEGEEGGHQEIGEIGRFSHMSPLQ